MSDTPAPPKPEKLKKRDYPVPADSVELARKRYVAAEAAVRVAFTGSDWRDAAHEDAGARPPRLRAAVLALEGALAIYTVVVLCATPKRHLAVAISRRPSEIRQACAAVELWRSGQLVDDMLERLRAAVAVDP